ncbi:hypothetical protein Tco_1187303 [Tanacetum coccineum]
MNVNSTSLVLSAHSYPADDPQCSTQIHVSINTITICLKWPGKSQTNKPEKEEQDEKDNPENINTNPSLPPDPSVSFIIKKVCKLNSFIESLGLVPQSSDIEFVCTKGDDGDMMFIVIINKNDDSHKEELEVGEKAGVGELEVEYFDVSPTRSELAYHKDDSHSNLRRQARDDALRKWEAQIDQLRREEHEVSECMMVYTLKNNVHQKETIQIERISSVPEKPNPESLTIPCLVDIFSINAIADIEASVNIMSESMLDELSLADPKHADMCTDIAKISRKRSKPDKHGHGNGIECARAGRMLSKVNKSQPMVNSGQP